MNFSDSQSKEIISRRFGARFADYAIDNLSGWVLDRLTDERIVSYGPASGRVECEWFFDSRPEFQRYL